MNVYTNADFTHKLSRLPIYSFTCLTLYLLSNGNEIVVKKIFGYLLYRFTHWSRPAWQSTMNENVIWMVRNRKLKEIRTLLITARLFGPCWVDSKKARAASYSQYVFRRDLDAWKSVSTSETELRPRSCWFQIVNLARVSPLLFGAR